MMTIAILKRVEELAYSPQSRVCGFSTFPISTSGSGSISG